MNPGKLAKRLRKELLANPKQGVVLAIVCLAACWFWSPLLLKWFKGKSKSQIANSAPAAATDAAIAKVEAQRPWFEIRAWRQDDPLTRSAPLPDDTRDPFRSVKPAQVVKEVQENQTEEPIAPPVQLEKLDLKLEAIVYSGSRRLAQINGLTVRENDEVPIDAEDVEGQVVLTRRAGRVVAIRPTEVELEVGGQSLRLTLQTKLLGRGEVVKRLRTQ